MANYDDIMQQSYVDYAMSVITDRAIPDVRDGLKPVQRRVLYDLMELGVLPDRQHKKCGRIVGDTMGKYHPHGDSSIYGALVHMSLPYKLNHPLIDGHGNFGSIDGDGAAAMRYTEARLSPIGYTLLTDCNPSVVLFLPNYDETETEPTVLPAIFPNLLVNGCEGLAVGMKTYIPSHNLKETMNALLAYSKNTKISLSKLMEIMPGPDFPTGGILANPEVLPSFYETGEGRFYIQARFKTEPGTAGKQNLIITEIPYPSSGNKAGLIDSIAKLMKVRGLEEVASIRDESTDEIRIVLECKKGTNINNLKNKLLKKTKCQETVSCNFLVLKDGKPTVLSLKEYFESFLAFEMDWKKKKYQQILLEIERKLELQRGLELAFHKIDAVIETIRFAKSITIAKRCLQTGDTNDITFTLKKWEKEAKTFSFTKIQVDYLMEMKLQRLHKLELIAIQKTIASLEKERDKYKRLVEDKATLLRDLQKEWEVLSKQYGTERKTLIKSNPLEDIIEEIKEENLMIVMDRFYYVKAMEASAYERLSEEDKNSFIHIKAMTNLDKLWIFTDKGSLVQIKGIEIPRAKGKEKGLALLGTFSLDGEEIICITSELTSHNLHFLYPNGYGKVVKREEFSSRQKQTIATKLYQNDRCYVSEEPFKIQTNQRIISTKEEQYVCCSKTIKGSRVVKLKKNEEIKEVL